ncbi:tetratricopeptide repeat protein [Legionella sp. CNM-4043-24]|uniref:tetratricopeptide repeat protein n=1 Tax=Legionella sp. CNM-4043-24 TaxID=3421646 RepID=UPI00403A9881
MASSSHGTQQQIYREIVKRQVIGHLESLANELVYPEEKEMIDLISRYKADDQKTPEELLELLDAIFYRPRVKLSQIKTKIQDTIRTAENTLAAEKAAPGSSIVPGCLVRLPDEPKSNCSFLFNPDKDAIIQQLGSQFLAGNYQHERTFIDIARAYRSQTETAVSQLCDESMRLIAQRNSSSAMVLRALLYQQALGGEQNYPAAIALLEKAITLENTNAMTLRALMHKRAQGGLQDYPAAIALLERAIALGNTNAMTLRADMHKRAPGGLRNYPAAIDLLERAIALKNADAMTLRAHMHTHTRDGSRNYAAAITLLEQAIALGDANAMNIRAVMHFVARGGERNYPAAIVLYERAITLGHKGAMFNRALMHTRAEGGERNYPAAIALYERAITLGHKGAMIFRASMHKHGQGGNRDLAAAIRLYQLAEQNGSVVAKAKLHKLIADNGHDIATPPHVEVVDPRERDTAFINQLFYDLTGNTCNSISGDRRSFNIEIAIPRARLAELTSQLVLSGATLQGKGPVTGDTKIICISNIGYDQLVSLTQPVSLLTPNRPHAPLSATKSMAASSTPDQETADSLSNNLLVHSIFRPEAEKASRPEREKHHDCSSADSPHYPM